MSNVKVTRGKDGGKPVRAKEENKIYNTMKLHGREYVLSFPVKRENSNIPEPDFLKTGKALAGILAKGQSLADFMLKKEMREVENQKLFNRRSNK